LIFIHSINLAIPPYPGPIISTLINNKPINS